MYWISMFLTIFLYWQTLAALMYPNVSSEVSTRLLRCNIVVVVAVVVCFARNDDASWLIFDYMCLALES